MRGEQGGTTGVLDQEMTEQEEGKEAPDVLHTCTDTQIHRNRNRMKQRKRDECVYVYIFKGKEVTTGRPVSDKALTPTHTHIEERDGDSG